ncbi:hypothetical protein jhhlp_001876 [Lomentospora prolificans]|uniref:Peptidyl-prolyl cis-trans isomerase n=1 Tax=Lomentospora prolificans TaxID=41688 RepID=A0A2N3NCD7_9PEZI|nr:hypothetical protein jhhlp_001876 [Lomentospora prolificans]
MSSLLTLPRQLETGLPPNWEVRHSNSKNLPYYFNAEETISRWEPPEGTDTEKLKVYMANHHAQRYVKPQGVVVPDGQIWAAHLLVKHNESRNPSSWKEPRITRSKDEARKIIEGYRDRIKAGGESETLGSLAKRESDCNSAHKFGDLGIFGRGVMQKEFEDAAFALEVGQLSGVVETASGLHLIER